MARISISAESSFVGLDVVELVMAVEDEFEIRLDDDFGDIRTVGDLHDVIWQQLNACRTDNLKDGCPSFPPFFATRDARFVEDLKCG